AAERGHGTAQHNLGFMHSKGIFVDVDVDEAVRWYHAAAEQDSAASQDDLALTLMQRRAEGDAALALEWSERAAALGYGPAMLHLGIWLRDGTLGPKDPEAALRWLFAALGAGEGDAVHEMHPLGKALSDEQIREADRRADGDGAFAESLIDSR